MRRAAPILPALLFLLSAPLAAQKSVTWETTWTAAQARARAEKKPVLVDVWTDWCGWCHKMARETFPAPAVQAQLARVVPLSLQTQDAKGSPLPQAWFEERYQVQGFPTLLLLDAEGNVLARKAGYLPPDRMEAWLKEVLAAKR